MRKSEIIQRRYLKNSMINVSLSIIRLYKMCSKDGISNIIFRGGEGKKSDIRLKSENLHPCIKHRHRSTSLLHVCTSQKLGVPSIYALPIQGLWFWLSTHQEAWWSAGWSITHQSIGHLTTTTRAQYRG